MESDTHAAARDTEMAVVDPANNHRGLAANNKDVAALVGEFARRWKDGKLRTERGGGAAVASKQNGLELAVGRDARPQIVVPAWVTWKHKEHEQTGHA